MLVPLKCAPPWSTPRRNPNTCPSPVPEYLECAHSALIPGTGEPPRETSNSWVGGLEDNCIKYENFNIYSDEEITDKHIQIFDQLRKDHLEWLEVDII